jgi:choline dehydrogenase-like flavoprotein
VFGTANLFVCDGSLLPATGYANTGLTIGALALRMAETINA